MRCLWVTQGYAGSSHGGNYFWSACVHRWRGRWRALGRCSWTIESMRERFKRWQACGGGLCLGFRVRGSLCSGLQNLPRQKLLEHKCITMYRRHNCALLEIDQVTSSSNRRLKRDMTCATLGDPELKCKKCSFQCKFRSCTSV